MAICEGNLPVTGAVLSQRASNANNGSISWIHDANTSLVARILATKVADSQGIIQYIDTAYTVKYTWPVAFPACVIVVPLDSCLLGKHVQGAFNVDEGIPQRLWLSFRTPNHNKIQKTQTVCITIKI